MPSDQRPLKVFLSYAHADYHAVHALYNRLILDSVDAWMDKEELIGGQDWEAEIRRAVRESDVVVVCLSRQFAQRGFRQYEVRIALEEANLQPEGEIYIIPARLEEYNVPYSLRRWHWVDLFEENGYDRLMRALRARADQIGSRLQTETDPGEKEERLKLLEKEAIRFELVGDLWNARKTWYEIRRVDPSFPRVDIKIEELEREVAEYSAHEKEKREAAREKAKRDAAERAGRERARRLADQQAALKKVFFKAMPFLRIGGIIGVVFLLFWAGTWAVPKFISLIPTPQATVTQSPTVQPTSTKTPVPPTKTPIPSATRTKRPTLTPTLGIGSTMTSEKDRMKLVYVSAGEFTMGSDADDVVAGCKKFERVITDCQRTRFTDEEPLHSVNVDAFWIDQTEVTNAMYENCVSAGACKEPTDLSYFGSSEFDNYPVLFVDWNMAKAYCSWSGRRLPTEAEWEKAARGTRANIYPWGNAFDGNIVNFCDINCGISHADESVNDGYGDVSPVGNYPSGQSIYGAYDMAGNVWEWVSSLYRPYPYDANDGRENLSSLASRVLRGGSWNSDGNVVRSAVRVYTTPDKTSWNFGFRCASSP